MKKKYLCVGGSVHRDGNWVDVPARDLPALYGVDPKECVFTDVQLIGHRRAPSHGDIIQDRYQYRLIELRPVQSGNYNLATVWNMANRLHHCLFCGKALPRAWRAVYCSNACAMDDA